MVCFSCFSPGGNGVRRIEIENGTRPGSRHSADSAGSGRGKKDSDDNVNGKGKATLNDTEGNSTRCSGARSFTFRELAAATRGFREVVAIKQLAHDGVQGFKEFLVEVLMLSLLHHPNLVTLIGYCTDGDQRLLVYEYMPMGSLEDHLFDLDPNKEPLSWNTRIKVAVGAARGLEHLHCKANPPVIYRDLKSANILLDNDFNTKLSDFGLAKLGPVGDNTHVSTRVMGTYGYCAPEYAMSGKLTLKSDIYSFGVVLLELITGRRAIDCSKKQGEQNLVAWSRPFLRDRSKFTQLVDPLLQGRFPVRCLHHAIAITAMCLQEQPTFRPLVGDIVVALEYLSSQSNTCEVHNSRIRSSLPRSSSQQDSDIFSHESDYRRSAASV